MKHAAHRLLTLLLLIVAIGSGYLCAQQTLYNNDTTNICTLASQNTLRHNYIHNRSAFDSWGVISGVDSTFTLTVWYLCERRNDLASGYGFIDIWDGDENTGTPLVSHFTGASLDMQSLPITQEQITVHIHYNAYSTDTIYPLQRHFELRWQRANPFQVSTNPCTIPFNIGANNITATGADIQWTPDTAFLSIDINGQTHVATGGTLNLSGLQPNTHYHIKASSYWEHDYPCCQKRVDFYTIPLSHTGCPDVLNLNSDYVRCFCDNSVEKQDYGPQLAFSRHTIHRDTTEMDSIADGLLHTVCPGKPGSVRLGNWLNGAESESIVYYLHIDTMLYSLIMLHYAAVLQNPNHASWAQPRFTMRILDQNDSVIDSQCGAADFISDSSLGWNTSYPDILWKDWTTVGINLAPYHGQDVRLQLRTYDCREGGHFGYAYFYAECQQPYASSDHCGTVDTVTLSAPEGFNYLWYHDSPSNPVSADRQATFSTEEGPVHCRLSFIENPTCYITMDTYVTNFWPHAIIDTLSTKDNGCNGYEVQFLNHSTIIDDNNTALPGNPPCETALWNFGDGFYSTDYSPIHTYRRPGTYTVTLISSLATNQCSDTTTYVLVTPDAWASATQYLTCCDSLLWLDSIWYSHDTLGPTARVHYYTCDTIYTLHLTTLPSSHFQLPVDTFCHNSSYTWHGLSAPINYFSPDTLYPILSDTLIAANGCDSIVTLPLVQLPPDTLSILIYPDCGLGYYTLTASTGNPLWRWTSSPHDTALDGRENDRQLWVFPDTATTYILTSYYDDSLFCPTTVKRSLSRPSFPQAKLEVNPSTLTMERNTLHAYDISSNYTNRQWAVVNYGLGDTIHLPDTLRRISYAVPFDIDSTTVILMVSNDLCLDTASRTLPFVHSIVFAPNTFTPNADINNHFTIVCDGALEAELTIYNRQGLLVFTANDLHPGWDGTHNGHPCKQDAYVWHLRIRTADYPAVWKEYIGTVTLLR